MTNESIKTKIAALLAKAEGTDNEHEASAFMAKVNELLEKHQIEMFEIRSHNCDKDPMSNLKGEMTRAHEWPSQVGWALARFYGCKMLRYKQATMAKYTWQVLGRESACVTFDLMFPYVIAQARQHARAFARKYGVTAAKAERSVGIALSMRIWAMVEQADAQRATNERNALVPVSDIDAYMADLGITTKESRHLTAPIFRGADEYAAKVSLNHQATASTARQLT